MAEVFETYSFTKELADVFAEDSDKDKTFYGFSEDDLSDQDHKLLENGDKGIWPDNTAINHESTSKAAQPFKLRVALRATRFSSLSSDEEGHDEDAEKVSETKKVNKKASSAKKERPVKSEEREKLVARLSPLKGGASDSAEEESFLAKRELNIKANKAMLAQLMADLQNMPGGAGLLKKQAGKQEKRKSLHQPRSGGELRKNPERASRRHTRSMTGNGELMEAQKDKLELTLEEELLEVREAPQRRGIPKANQTKPHNIRPVEDITEEELELVADNMTEKIYNKVMGSTCHQCRQKTIDTKTCCRNEGCRGIQGQFCGPCLRNRYGEDVKKALLNPAWHCPPCRGICNCSFCRQREGRCPTGILFPLAQYHGFSDVHSYLTSLRNKVNKEHGEDE